MGSFMSALLKGALYGMKEKKILMLGVAGAGKTTILHKLDLGEVVTTTTSIGNNIETLKILKTSFIALDIGSQDKITPLWKHYFQNTHGLIFVVDSTDKRRISEARDVLHRLLDEDKLYDARLLVYANKNDLPNAMCVSEITDKLGLHMLQQRQWYVQSACATSGEGLYDGLQWLLPKIDSWNDIQIE